MFTLVPHSLITKMKGWVLARILRLLHLTWRIHVEGREYLDEFQGNQSRFLLCFWHGKYIPIFPLLEGYEACVISSLSRRGSVIAEICKNFGYQTVQIPDQPSIHALRNMEHVFLNTLVGGIAVDGPLGPRHQPKNGVIRLASTFGFRLVPVTVKSQYKLVLKKRWDHLELPLPGAKIFLIFGPPYQVPSGLSRKQMPAEVRKLTRALLKLEETVD